MGNFCSVCYPHRSPNKNRPTSLPYPESSGLLPAQNEVPVHIAMVGGAQPVPGSTSQAHLAISKSETYALLGNLPPPGNSNSLKSEKRSLPSLASKLSGTLNRSNSESRAYSESKITSLFEKYKDESEDCILSEGIEEFCIDLQLKPDEFKVLVLAWKFEAEQMCRFTRQEFLTGCKALKADSCKGIQARLPEVVVQTLADQEKFKELYRFTYKFGLDCSSGQRILPVDMAVSLWLLVFSQNEPPLLKKWLHFLEKHPEVRGIPRDTWNMFLNFTTTVGNDLTQYDDTEAWPSLFDDFVEFENDQLNQNSSTMQDLNRESSSSPSS